MTRTRVVAVPRPASVAAASDIASPGRGRSLRRRARRRPDRRTACSASPTREFAGIGGAAMRAAGWRPGTTPGTRGDGPGRSAAPSAAPAAPAPRLRSACWRGNPTCSSASTRPTSTSASRRWLKQRGIRTVHYVSPSVWAWREKRAAKIGESADRVLCLFPMEPPIYAKHGVDARFVGHPLADAIPLEPDRAPRAMRSALPEHGPVLAAAAGQPARRNREDAAGVPGRCGPDRAADSVAVDPDAGRERAMRCRASANSCTAAETRGARARAGRRRAARDDRQRRGAAGIGHRRARSHALQTADGGRPPDFAARPTAS